MLKLVGSFFNRHAVTVLQPLRLLVSVWFQVYFTPLSGVLFTFPSRYLFTIDLQKYLALAVSSAGFPQAFRVLKYSRTITKEKICFRLQGYYLLSLCFPANSANIFFCNSFRNKTASLSYNPYHASTIGLGLSRFARRY